MRERPPSWRPRGPGRRRPPDGLPPAAASSLASAAVPCLGALAAELSFFSGLPNVLHDGGVLLDLRLDVLQQLRGRHEEVTRL
eukprot:4065194-Pyramimonas_sp.AAC.1